MVRHDAASTVRLLLVACMLLGELDLRRIPFVLGSNQGPDMAPIFVRRTPEEKRYLRSIRESFPDYLKEVFDTMASQPSPGDLTALARVSAEGSRRLTFNISSLPPDARVDHAELVIPRRRRRRRCLIRVRTEPERDPVVPVREVAGDSNDVVLDATGPVLTKELSRQTLLMFDVAVRSHGRRCHHYHFRDLDLRHAYLVTMDYTAHQNVRAHRIELSRTSGRARGNARFHGDGTPSATPVSEGVRGGRREGVVGETPWRDDVTRRGRRQRRRRRQVLAPSSVLPSAPAPACRLETWRQDVESLDMDTVIYPSSLLINRCAGACRPPEFNNVYVNHTFIKGVYALRHPSEAVPFSCVPVAFSPVSVLFYHNQTSTIRRMNILNFRATSCGCR